MSSLNVCLRSRRLAAALVSVALAGAAGCASNGENDSNGSRTVAPLPATQPSDARSDRSNAAGTTHTVMAYPTGDRNSSTLLIEKFGPAQIRLNKPTTYELKVTNLTNNPLNNIQLREQLNGSFKVASASDVQTANERGIQTYNLGELGPKESKTINVTGTADQPGRVSS